MKKILVIDNDKDVLDVVKIMLTNQEFVVKTTSQWQLILNTLVDFLPDLIFLDIDLGGADGCEVCKKLKLSNSVPNTAIILISVHSMPDKYIKECYAQGFLKKPFHSADLLEIIQKNVN